MFCLLLCCIPPGSLPLPEPHQLRSPSSADPSQIARVVTPVLAWSSGQVKHQMNKNFTTTSQRNVGVVAPQESFPGMHENCIKLRVPDNYATILLDSWVRLNSCRCKTQQAGQLDSQIIIMLDSWVEQLQLKNTPSLTLRQSTHTDAGQLGLAEQL